MYEMEYMLARKIRELANLITKNRDIDICNLGLTAVQADVILFFAENQGKSVVDLKIFLGITHQTARGIVQRMVHKGLLTMIASETDARYKKIFLTKKGVMVYKNMQKNGTYTGNKLLNGMSTKEKKQFLSLVTLALKNLNANEGQQERK